MLHNCKGILHKKNSFLIFIEINISQNCFKCPTDGHLEKEKGFEKNHILFHVSNISREILPNYSTLQLKLLKFYTRSNNFFIILFSVLGGMFEKLKIY